MEKILTFLDLSYHLAAIAEDFEQLVKKGAFSIDESEKFDFKQADKITRTYATNFFRGILTRG